MAAEGEGKVRAFTVSTAYVKTALVAKQLPDTADRRGMTVDEVVEKVMLERTRVKEMMEPERVIWIREPPKHECPTCGGEFEVTYFHPVF